MSHLLTILLTLATFGGAPAEVFLRSADLDVAPGDTLEVELRVMNALSQSITIELYTVVELDGVFLFYPAFTQTPQALASGVTLPPNFESGFFPLFTARIDTTPPDPMTLTWYAASFDSTNGSLTGGPAMVMFNLLPSAETPTPGATHTPSPTPQVTETPTPPASATPSPTPLVTPTIGAPGAFVPDYETSSGFFTQMSQPERGTGPHGTMRVWYSMNLRTIITQSSFQAPVGSVAIKQADFNHDGRVDALEIMIKEAPGYDPAHRDWKYEVRSADGTQLQQSGKLSGCWGCHDQFTTKDYLGATGYAN